MDGHLILVLVCLIGLISSQAMASNYAHLIESIVARNRATREHYIQNHPGGHRVFSELERSDNWNGHPILEEGDGASFGQPTDDDWAAFLAELKAAHQRAKRISGKNHNEVSENFLRTLVGMEKPDSDVDENLENIVDSKQDFIQFIPKHFRHLKHEEVTDKDTDEEPLFLPEEDTDPEAEASEASIIKNSDQAVRRAEVAFQNHLWGEHRVSGGSSELGQWIDFALLGAGAQDSDKTDDTMISVGEPSGKTNPKTNFGEKVDKLPTYCDPPNPCPIGYNPDNLSTPCDRNVVDSKEFNQKWIWDRMLSGECHCDTEHMKHCPWQLPPKSSPVREKTSIGLENIDDFLNPYMRGQMREQLVAKKSAPTLFRSKRANHNPYLDGRVLEQVVKKDGHQIEPEYIMK